eukprot:401321-Amphidinium_carterae.2
MRAGPCDQQRLPSMCEIMRMGSWRETQRRAYRGTANSKENSEQWSKLRATSEEIVARADSIKSRIISKNKDQEGHRFYRINRSIANASRECKSQQVQWDQRFLHHCKLKVKKMNPQKR